jgi:hypothetical protein
MGAVVLHVRSRGQSQKLPLLLLVFYGSLNQYQTSTKSINKSPNHNIESVSLCGSDILGQTSRPT